MVFREILQHPATSEKIVGIFFRIAFFSFTVKKKP